MTDTTATQQARFLYELTVQPLEDPNADLVTPIQDFINATENPTLELIVLTSASIHEAAQTVLALANNNRDEARIRVAYATIANDVNEILTECGDGK